MRAGGAADASLLHFFRYMSNAAGDPKIREILRVSLIGTLEPRNGQHKGASAV